MEVPEIEDEIIEIKGVSRAPGERSKVVVFSSDIRIDAVGACVGMRGSRIQSIVRELNGEKIDIINFSDQPEILLTRAIAPAKPLNMLLDEKQSYAVIVFEDEELAVAIGRNGQNISLASDVTGFTIDAISKSDYNKQHGIVDENHLSTISGFSAPQLELLSDIDVTTCDDFLENGYTKEEMKLVNETHKILSDSKINISATAVRIPVVGGHSESVNVELKKPSNLKEIYKILDSSPGVIVKDNPSENSYPMPIYSEGKNDVFVGRIRTQIINNESWVSMWIVADNVYGKGAALNAVQILEQLIENNKLC